MKLQHGHRYVPCREVEFNLEDIPDEAVRMSRITKALEDAFNEIRGHVPEVRAAIFTVYLLRTRPVRGYYWKNSWRRKTRAGENKTYDEIHISSHILAEGPESVLRTLLHEAAHSLATAREIQEVSRQNRYHNNKFKALAEELGLKTYNRGPADGWGTENVEPDEITVGRWRKAYIIIHDALVAAQDLPWMISLGNAGRFVGKGRAPITGAKKGGMIKLTCACGTIIRASRKVAELETIGCSECGELFTEDR